MDANADGTANTTGGTNGVRVVSANPIGESVYCSHVNFQTRVGEQYPLAFDLGNGRTLFVCRACGEHIEYSVMRAIIQDTLREGIRGARSWFTRYETK